MRKLRITVLCILAITLSSCLDMLDKDPISQLSVDKLFETADGADAAVVTVSYTELDIIGKNDGYLLLKELIYLVVPVVQPIINGQLEKIGGVTGG